MTILTGALGLLGSAAADIASKIIPGASALPDLVKAGEAVVAAFNTVKQHNGNYAQDDAQQKVDDLLEKVNTHADSTLGRLEGDT
jgi:hypothetical protein